MTTLTRRISWQEFRQMDFPDDDLAYYELIDGELVKKSAPSPKHQIITANFFRALDRFARERALGLVLFAFVDVFLDDYNLVQPDALFLFNANLGRITDDGILGAPDLVAEIISPSSETRDRVAKRQLYERFGVGEYWLIDAQARSVEAYRLGERGYERVSSAAGEGVVASALLQGFSIQLRELFE